MRYEYKIKHVGKEGDKPYEICDPDGFFLSAHDTLKEARSVVADYEAQDRNRNVGRY